jgi:hypothetical protein
MKPLLSILMALLLPGCSALEDAATSLANDIESGVHNLSNNEGATYVIVHDAKARAGSNVRSFTVQFDKVGALIVWYKDADGKVLESGSTSYHSRFVDTPQTIIVDKDIDAPLSILVQRQRGRAVVEKVY